MNNSKNILLCFLSVFVFGACNYSLEKQDEVVSSTVENEDQCDCSLFDGKGKEIFKMMEKDLENSQISNGLLIEENRQLRNFLLDSKEWLTYENKKLGFSFQYPISSGTLEYEGVQVCEEMEEFKKFGGGNNAFSFGGIGITGCPEGRDSNFFDFSGYDEEYLKYFVILKRFKNSKGVEVVMLKGDGESMPGNVLPEGEFGAVINLKNKDFPGVAFSIYPDVLSVEDFEKILDTVDVK